MPPPTHLSQPSTHTHNKKVTGTTHIETAHLQSASGAPNLEPMLLQRSCVRLQQFAVALSTLTRLQQHCTRHPERLDLGELFKLGILIKDPSDVLELRSNDALLRSLGSRYEQLRSGATPFQRSLLDVVLLRGPACATSSPSCAGLQASATDSALATHAAAAVPAGVAPPVTAREYYNAIMELIKEVEGDYYRAVPHPGRAAAKAQSGAHSGAALDEGGAGEVYTAGVGEALGSSRAAVLSDHLSALEPHLRQLSGAETLALVSKLAKLNHCNYEHTQRLTRRGCEVASQLSHRDLCQLFFNLHKLHTRDSCVSIINHILEHANELSADEISRLTFSLERQEYTSSASQQLLFGILPQAVKKLDDATAPSYHRALLVSMARYHISQATAVQAVLRHWVHRWRASSTQRDVLCLFEAATTLVGSAQLDGLHHLTERLTDLAPDMELRNIDRAMDLLSMVPMHLSESCMRALLHRLESEAGRLSVGQLVYILHLLSSYPPAKGDVAVVSLAYAASLRASALDVESLESVVVSLAMLQLFTDDFFTVAHVLQAQKGGMRNFASLLQLLEHLTPEVAATRRGLGMLGSVVSTMAPVMREEEVLTCRRALLKLGVQDPDVLRSMFSTAKKPNHAPPSSPPRKKRRGGYTDPMADLL